MKSVFGSTPFFREFTLSFPRPSNEFVEFMMAGGILPGLPMPALGEGVMLVTATEKRTREQMDRFVDLARDFCAGGLS